MTPLTEVMEAAVTLPQRHADAGAGALHVNGVVMLTVMP
jgi:hypothetical protein